MTLRSPSMDPNPQLKLPESGRDSVRSTQSLSVFVNPDTPNEMARSEEVTMHMYANSPDDFSPNAAVSGNSKRRHRDTSEKAAEKENRKTESSSASKPGFFKFLKKKKPQETKPNDSSVSTVEITSTSMHIGKKEDVTTDAENSRNRQTELESSQTHLEVGSSGAASTQGGLVTEDRIVETVESKSTTSATTENRIDVVSYKVEVEKPSAVFSDSSKHSAAMTAGPTTSSAAAAGIRTSGSLEKPADTSESRKRVGKQQYDEKKELEGQSISSATAEVEKFGSLEKPADTSKSRKTAEREQDGEKKEVVVHTLPSYSPADVDLSSSAVRDNNVRAKFEAMLGGGESGGSGFSTPQKPYPRQGVTRSSTANSESGSAASTLTRQRKQQERREELVPSAAVERMAKMPSTSAAKQVPRVIHQPTSKPQQSLLTSTENREYQMDTDSSMDDLSLQEDVLMDATTYYAHGESLTPPARKTVGRQEPSKSTSSEKERGSKPNVYTEPHVQENTVVVTTVSKVQAEKNADGSDIRPMSDNLNKTSRKSAAEVQRSQHVSKTSTRIKEQPSSSATTVKTANVVQERKDVSTKVSSVQNVNLEKSYGPDRHAASTRLIKDYQKMSDQVGRPDSDIDVKKVQQAQKTKAQEDHHKTTSTSTNGDASSKQTVYTNMQVAGVHSIHVQRPDTSDGRSREVGSSSSTINGEREPSGQKMRTEYEKDRDSTPTPIAMMDFSEEQSTVRIRSAKTDVGRWRADSPGVHGVQMGVTESGQRASDVSDNTESGSEVEQRQHDLKAITQAELLAQAKRKTTTTSEAATGDRDVRTDGKSTYTITVSSYAPQHGSVEMVPSKASLSQRREDVSRGNELEDQADGKRHRSAAVYSGRLGSGEVGHRQQVVEGYGDDLEWRGRPSEDGPELRSHMRPREHQVPARSRSYASSDISSSIESQSSVEQDRVYTAVESNRRRSRSRSSSDATMTDDHEARPYGGRRTGPAGREHIRRTTSLPMSDEVDAIGDPAVVGARRGYNAAPVIKRRQQDPVLYAGRSKAPVSGRQKINRTTETPDDDDEAAIRAEPRSAYIYVDDTHKRQDYERAPRQRQVPSGRARLDHGVSSSAASSSPDDIQVSSGRVYADMKPPPTNDDLEYGEELDVAVSHPSQRRAPTGRTGKIQRSGDADIRVTSSSPPGSRRVGTPTSMDDRKYRQLQSVKTNASYTRRTPMGRTKGIHHGSTGNLDINIIDGSPDNVPPGSSKQVPDGQRTPNDWLRHQRSGRLTVDVVGQSGESTSLHRAYRSMPDLMDDDGHTDEIVPTKRPRNYAGYNEGDNANDSIPPQLPSSNPDGLSGGRVTATIRETSGEPRGADEVDVRHRQRCFSSSGTEQRDGAAGVIGRKRGVITGATVENRGGRGRSGRTNDMPSTDVEDLYDVGRTSARGGRQPSHVARVYVGGDDDDASWESQDDAASVFSEPPRRGRSRLSNTILSQSVTSTIQQRPSAVLTPANRPPPLHMPPTMPVSVPQETFELAHVDTQIQTDVGSPEATISSVDPALRDASKQGTNYHITLSLKPTVTATSPRNNTVTSHPQLMTPAHAVTSSGEPYAGVPSVSRRAVSSMAVYAGDDPRRTAPQPSPRRPTTPSTLPGRRTPAARPRSRSRSATRPTDGQIGFDVEVRDDDRVVRTSTTTRQVTNVTEYELEPQIGSVEFNYSPPQDGEEPVDFRRRPPPAAPPGGRHGHPHPHHSDDEMMRSHRVRSQQQQQQHLPDIQRGNFLIVNSIDATKAPKVEPTLYDAYFEILR